MCQINISKVQYAGCGHIEETEFRSHECSEYEEKGTCSNEKKNYLGQTKKKGECTDCETTSTKPDAEA